ncbi:MAG: CBS domain-containing protein, partial [Boseongicola sp.]|nr:CBS domain-containing protein [Boseongicola sp.]
MSLPDNLTQFLASVHPYDNLSDAALADMASGIDADTYPKGTRIFTVGDIVSSLYVIVEGEVEITDETGVQLSLLGPRNSFGERALLRGGDATRTATVATDATVIVVPSTTLFALIGTHAPVAKFFNRRHDKRNNGKDLATMPVEKLMSRDPVTCSLDTPIREAAKAMHDQRISSICISDGTGFCGIVTLRDMNGRVIVEGSDPSAAVSTVMTAEPLTLGPKALVTDVLHLMVERGIGHIPIVDGPDLLGIVTQTDLTRAQAMSSADLVRRVSKAANAQEMARATADIPQLLVQLVETGNRHEVVTRLITDITDTTTRRLLKLAEVELGEPPVPYLWLACGSQG